MPPVDLLRPYPAENMLAWPVGKRVGNVRNNDPELLEQTTAISDDASSARERACA
jgi:putative SOS response-associated peptidase YedK